MRCLNWRIEIDVPWPHVEKVKRKFDENRRVQAEVLKVNTLVIKVGFRARGSDVGVRIVGPFLMSEKFVNNCRPKFGERDEGRRARGD